MSGPCCRWRSGCWCGCRGPGGWGVSLSRLCCSCRAVKLGIPGKGERRVCTCSLLLWELESAERVVRTLGAMIGRDDSSDRVILSVSVVSSSNFLCSLVFSLCLYYVAAKQQCNNASRDRVSSLRGVEVEAACS